MKNKVAIITGASSGIGQATAIAIAEKGGKVVLAARREERLKELANSIHEKGGEAVYLPTDVTSRTEMKELIDFAIKEFGKIDVLVNNAGLMPLSFMNKLKVDEWDRMVDVNIKGVLYGIAAALPIMEEQKSGHIINVSSVAGHRVGIGGAVYSGTKFAVRAITEGLRQEVSPLTNIRTTIISPGKVETELRNTITDQDALKAVQSRNPDTEEIPLNPSSIANAIVYAIEQPEDCAINEMIIRPVSQKS